MGGWRAHCTPGHWGSHAISHTFPPTCNASPSQIYCSYFETTQIQNNLPLLQGCQTLPPPRWEESHSCSYNTAELTPANLAYFASVPQIPTRPWWKTDHVFLKNLPRCDGCIPSICPMLGKTSYSCKLHLLGSQMGTLGVRQLSRWMPKSGNHLQKFSDLFVALTTNKNKNKGNDMQG